MHIGRALIAIRKAKKLRPKQVYLTIGMSQGEYSQLSNVRFPREASLQRHLRGLKVTEAAALLWAIDLDQVPQHLKVALITLREQIIK